MLSRNNKPRRYDSEQHKIYYMLNRETVLKKRRIDRHFQKISKEFTYIMSYEDMLDTLRYIRKTFY